MKKAPIGHIFMKFLSQVFFENDENTQISLISDRNNGSFTWRPIYIYIYCSVVLREGNVLVKIMFYDSIYERKHGNTPKWVTDIDSVFSQLSLNKETYL